MPVLLDRFPNDDDGPPESAVLRRALPEGYGQAVGMAFERAVLAADEVFDRYFDIGGGCLRLRFAGSRLAGALTPALAHRLRGVGTAGGTIRVWDWATTGVEIPLPPCPATLLSRAAREPDVVMMWDEANCEGAYWVRDGRKLPVWEAGAPLRSVLHWWLQGKGFFLMHAAAVGLAGGGVLLAGPSGSGKSTSALACLESCLGYAGDDYVLIGSGTEPFVHSLYGSAKVHADQAWRLPHLLPLVRNGDRADREKALLFLSGDYSGRLLAGFPLRAILLPRVAGGRDSRLRPMRGADALRTMAPSTLMQLPAAGPETFAAMAEMTKRVPCFALELGTELRQVPEVIGRLLDAA
jgi:hypothetical protein